MSDERRKHPRIFVKSADIRGAEATHFQVLQIVDLSLSGVRLEITAAKTELKPGVLVDVRMEWQGQDAVFNATVRHIEPSRQAPPAGEPPRFEVGLEFDDPELVGKLLGPWYDDEVTRL